MKLILTLLVLFLGYLLYPVKDIIKLRESYVLARRGDFFIQSKRPQKWVSLKNIPKEARDAIVLSEDWNYYRHSGVDWGQLYQAIKENVTGQRLRGASTITQQVIKNLFFDLEKIYFRKAHEIVLSLIADKVLTKEKVLEIYFNIIHLGKNIYGIGSGAYFYFEKKVFQLGAKEGAFLAMLLPSP